MTSRGGGCRTAYDSRRGRAWGNGTGPSCSGAGQSCAGAGPSCGGAGPSCAGAGQLPRSRSRRVEQVPSCVGAGPSCGWSRSKLRWSRSKLRWSRSKLRWSRSKLRWSRSKLRWSRSKLRWSSCAGSCGGAGPSCGGAASCAEQVRAEGRRRLPSLPLTKKKAGPKGPLPVCIDANGSELHVLRPSRPRSA